MLSPSNVINPLSAPFFGTVYSQIQVYSFAFSRHFETYCVSLSHPIVRRSSISENLLIGTDCSHCICLLFFHTSSKLYCYCSGQKRSFRSKNSIDFSLKLNSAHDRGLFEFLPVSISLH